MPIFTTTLLLFVTLAALALSIRSHSRVKKLREKRSDNERMKLAAKICEAATRDAFGLDLDYSLESISALDQAITSNWSQNADHSVFSQNSLFVLSAYLGEIFVRSHGAEWILTGNASVPYLYFTDIDLKASPFDLVEQKLEQPATVSLDAAARDLIDELDRRRNPSSPDPVADAS
jgi:hypothetical protein